MQARRWTLLAGVVTFLGASTWLLLGGATRGAEIANVLALPVALVGLAVAVMGVVPQRRSCNRCGAGSS